jgi:hypothetical protein
MEGKLHEYDVERPIGVEFTKGDTHDHINFVDVGGQPIRIRVRAAELVQLLSDLKKGFGEKAS